MENIITLNQWEKLIAEVQTHVAKSNQPDDVIYTSVEKSKSKSKSRHCIYDNYDRYYSPGLDFVIEDSNDKGRLTVYNGSEMAYAPITFEEGLQIAQNFFNEYGGQMAEEIVCDYVMDGNPTISLMNQNPV